MRNRRNRSVECSPCSKESKEFLHDVGSGELGLDVLQCVLLDILNPKLSNVSAPGTSPYRRYPLPLPKNTSNEENTAEAVSPRCPPLGQLESKSGGVQSSSGPCRHKKGATSTYGHISHLSHRRSNLTYVFHAPDISVTTSRLSAVAASLWYFLSLV